MFSSRTVIRLESIGKNKLPIPVHVCKTHLYLVRWCHIQMVLSYALESIGHFYRLYLDDYFDDNRLVIGYFYIIIIEIEAALANDPTERADLKSRTGWMPKSLSNHLHL